MGSIHNLLTRVQKVDFDQIKQNAIEQTKEEIAPLIQEQLQQGIKGNGNKITPNYADIRYAAKKFNMNPLAGFTVPDLKLTGAFYSKIITTVNKGTFTTQSTDDKADKLEKEYGSKIYQLTTQNKSVYALQFVKPKLIGDLRLQIGI